MMNLVSKKLLFSLRSLHLGMIMLLATTTSPSIFLASFSVSAEEATGIGNSNNSNNVCVDIGRGEFTCTNDPLAVRQYVDSQQLQNQYQQYLGDDASSASIYLSRGVAQRVDGSESEKKAIQEVLKLMDDYFNKEILALPEYASVRNRCINTNELCAFWSSVGECETNRVFMLTNCAAACRFCLLTHTNLA